MSVMKEVEVLRAACCIAGLDQDIDPRERILLQKLADHVGVGSASLEAIINRSRQDPDFYQEQFEIIRADPDKTMKTLFFVAIADKVLTKDERIVLYRLSQKLGMDNERYNQLLAAAEKHV